MYTSQRGFAIGAVIGIVAILALLGGGAYVATNYDADIETDMSTTTDEVRFDGGVTITDEATTTLEATTSVDATIDTSVNAGAGVNVNLGY